MKESNLAKRYARALAMDFADEGEYERVISELRQFRKWVDGDERLRVSLETPLISARKKRELLDLIGEQAGLSGKTRSFLAVVLEETRLAILDQILEQLENVWFEKRGIDRMTVFSPVPIDAGQEQRLKRNLEKSFGRSLILKQETDASLIAGLKIQYGSESFDFSLKGNLEKLREKLVE